jgi:hypothetical protein
VRIYTYVSEYEISCTPEYAGAFSVPAPLDHVVTAAPADSFAVEVNSLAYFPESFVYHDVK